MSAPADVESHHIGEPTCNWRSPSLPTSSIDSPAAGSPVSPPASRPNCTLPSTGFDAAAADLTTRTSEKPDAVAVSTRSAPANTSVYVAREPSSVGTGRSPWPQETSSQSPESARTRASGPAPPAENSIGTAVATGRTAPDDITSEASTGTHPPACSTRTGVAEISACIVPSGNAVTRENSDVDDSTTTGSPVACASAEADDSGSAIGAGGADGGAGGSVGAASPAPTPKPTNNPAAITDVKARTDKRRTTVIGIVRIPHRPTTAPRRCPAGTCQEFT